jgi:hypothetical protein
MLIDRRRCPHVRGVTPISRMVERLVHLVKLAIQQLGIPLKS